MHLGQDPVAEVAHYLHPGVAPGQPLPDQRVSVPAPLGGQREQAVQFGAEQDRVGGRFLAALVPEQRHSHLPALARGADH